MAEVTINYKGATIATMDASGTKTLNTRGKYCEGDIGVVYAKPASPSGTKQISITQNGTTTEDVTNYANAQITANVPNTYAASDEGKVVNNGALVSQGSDTVTQNGTVDTTLINSLTVNVSGGGGGNDFAEFVARTPTSFNRSDITIIGAYVFTNYTTLTSAIFPNVTEIGTRTFYQCTNLQTLYLHGLLTLPYNSLAFYQVPASLAFPNASGNVPMNCFSTFYGPALDFGPLLINIASASMAGSVNLATIVLRNSTIVTLQNVSAFNNTPFASGKSGGTIYIPKTLYDHLGDGTSNDYKAATNWSTINGYGTITWAKIEGSIYETQYVDGTPIT